MAKQQPLFLFFKNGITKKEALDSFFVTEFIWPRSLFLLFFISKLSSLLRLLPTYGNEIVSTPWLQSPEEKNSKSVRSYFILFH